MDACQQVVHAVHVLYHNADPAAKREADDWLNQFQQTPEAWQTADQLLHTPMQEGSEVWYFAAQTIRTKIWNDFEQLPEAAHGSLRDSLLSHLTQRAEGAGHILTQLCLALACLAVRMASWEQPIHDVHARLGSATRAILEFLTVLPECALDSRLLVERGRRAAVRASLAAAAPHVYALLGHVQQGDAQGAHLERALRCFLSWFRLSAAEICRADQEAAEGGGADGAARAATRDAAVRELAAKAEPLVQLGTAQLLKPDDDCFEVAVDLSIELVRLLTGEGGGERDGSALGAGGDVALARQAHALAMLSQLLGPLGAQLQAHVASQDEDAARGLCRLFAEVGESCAPLLANVLGGTLPPAVAASIDPATARHAAELVQILLAASAHPTAHVAEVCLNCWYLLMQELTVRLDGERRGAAQLAWTGAYLQLSRALVRAMVLPDTSDGWSADAFDDFRSFRYVCGDALCDAAKVVGGGVLLGAIVEAVRSGLEQLEGGVWRPLDGALQAAKAVAAHVGAQQEEPVASMLAAIVRLPLSTAHHLLYTALLCASSYSAWLHAHPDKLGSVLLFASSCLQAGDAKVAPAACIGLKNICDSCSEELAAEPWASQLLSLVAQSAELPLKSVDRVELLQGCGYVYSLLPVPAVVRCLEALGSPMLSRLAQLCAEGAPAPPPSEVLSVLDQLVGLVRYCQVGVGEFDEFHPIANLLSAAWPVLCAVHARCGKDSSTMERVCRVVKFSVRTAGGHTGAMLPAILKTLSGWFEKDAHSCFLYVLHVCASNLSGHSPPVDEAICATYARMSARVVALLQPTSAAAATEAGLLDALGAYPDVLEDFFQLSIVMLARFPCQLLLSDCWQPLAQLVAPCARLPHSNAWTAATKFAEHLLLARLKRVDMEPAALAVLDATVARLSVPLAAELLRGIAGALPVLRVPRCSTMLRAIVECVPEQGAAWVADACAALPQAAQAEAGPMVMAITHRSASERDMRRAVDAFSEVCRRRRLL